MGRDFLEMVLRVVMVSTVVMPKWIVRDKLLSETFWQENEWKTPNKALRAYGLIYLFIIFTSDRVLKTSGISSPRFSSQRVFIEFNGFSCKYIIEHFRVGIGVSKPYKLELLAS